MSAPARVGIAGLGTVGWAVARELAERVPAAELVVALVRDPSRHLEQARSLGPATVLTADPADLLGAGCDVVVECTGDVALARRVAHATLARGAGVVTASKQCLAAHGPELQRLAGRHRAPLRFEAAVGGGMPVISVLSGALRADRVQRLAAVLNGTTNLVLDRMTAGDSLDDALRSARAQGLAEADASQDVDAHDPVAKLVILAAVVWGGWPAVADVARCGIGELDPADLRVAAGLGYAVRLVARAEAEGAGVALAVEPTLVPRDHPLAQVRGAGNAVVIESDLAGRTVVTGTGAGAAPTASAMLSDLILVLADRQRGAAPAPLAARLTIAAPRPTRAVWRLGAGDGRPDELAAAADLSACGLTAGRLSGDRAGPASTACLVVTAPATAAERAAAAVALAWRGGYAVHSCLPILEP
ncbi:MAG TPA: homoserine dehydrogenase [Verrucomicrobiae bacterium]|nr:homoserine dehydrogenase [Verrucomicrobiae bacterium]